MRDMTIDQFCERLAACAGEWHLDRHGRIRGRIGNVIGEDSLITKRLFNIDIPDSDYVAIYRAAEAYPDHDPALRKRLLVAVKLTETGGAK